MPNKCLETRLWCLVYLETRLWCLVCLETRLWSLVCLETRLWCLLYQISILASLGHSIYYVATTFPQFVFRNYLWNCIISFLLILPTVLKYFDDWKVFNFIRKYCHNNKIFWYSVTIRYDIRQYCWLLDWIQIWIANKKIPAETY